MLQHLQRGWKAHALAEQVSALGCGKTVAHRTQQFVSSTPGHLSDDGFDEGCQNNRDSPAESLKLRKKKVLTVVLNTEHEARYSQVSEKRWEGRSYSTKIAEVEKPDTPDEKELPVGEDRGFLWRLYAYWRLEEVEDGVFAECVSVSLSRRIPAGLGWVVKPFVSSMPRESLEEVLQATRVAVKVE